MFADLETLIINEQISNIEIVELYKATSEALSKDCEICNDVPQIEELRNVTRSIHEKLEFIMISEKKRTNVSSGICNENRFPISNDSQEKQDKFQYWNLYRESISNSVTISDKKQEKFQYGNLYTESITNSVMISEKKMRNFSTDVMKLKQKKQLMVSVF